MAKIKEHTLMATSIKSAKAQAIKYNQNKSNRLRQIIINTIKLYCNDCSYSLEHGKNINIYTFKMESKSKIVRSFKQKTQKQIKKVFGKIQYTKSTTHKTKKSATLKANQLKKSGYHIRIIKENGMYSIYKHKK